MQLADAVARGELRPKIPADIGGTLAILLLRCWAQEPKDRPSIAEVVQLLHSAKRMEWSREVKKETDALAGL